MGRSGLDLAAFTSNADLDRFRYVFRAKQDGHTLSVYDGKKLIGKVGAITAGNCYTDDQPALVKYRRHANVVSAEILPEYRGQKLYQEMLLRFREHAKEKLGCKGLRSEGFQRSPMATRAWEKVAERADADSFGRKNFFLDGLPKRGRVPLATAKRVLAKLGRKAAACRITPAALREGMEVEREHRDVTRGGVLNTAKIAAAHLCEDSRYYRALKQMERKLKRRK